MTVLKQCVSHKSYTCEVCGPNLVTKSTSVFESEDDSPDSSARTNTSEELNVDRRVFLTRPNWDMADAVFENFMNIYKRRRGGITEAIERSYREARTAGGVPLDLANLSENPDALITPPARNTNLHVFYQCMMRALVETVLTG